MPKGGLEKFKTLKSPDKSVTVVRKDSKQSTDYMEPIARKVTGEMLKKGESVKNAKKIGTGTATAVYANDVSIMDRIKKGKK